MLYLTQRRGEAEFAEFILKNSVDQPLLIFLLAAKNAKIAKLIAMVEYYKISSLILYFEFSPIG